MILNIFSKRNAIKKECDIFEYSTIPDKLRVQVSLILINAFKNTGNNMYNGLGSDTICNKILEILRMEYGTYSLFTMLSDSNFINDPLEEYFQFINKIDNIENFLDAIEVGLHIIKEFGYYGRSEKVIIELNHRFIENNIGYEYIEDKFIRIDRKFTHNEIVKPALNLLFEKEFENANNEFLNGLKYYKTGCSKDNPNEDFKNAIINCNKAFESTMKIICEFKDVPNYNSKHTSNELINDLIDANILPKHLENSFHGLKNIIKGIKSSLENGLPVIRNKVGHGIGTEEEWISEEYVTYAINLLATNIILLVNIYKKLP